MARIRSVHPGFFTDETFVAASPLARLLLIGIWTECDDYGAFAWKPVTLKMRLLPADNADPVELMAELEAAGSIRRYEVGGKVYGAVRGFQKWQRPKKPLSSHPIPAELLPFLGGSDTPPEDDESAPVGKEFPTATPPLPPSPTTASPNDGNRPADGGGRREDEGGRKEGSELRSGAAGAVGLPMDLPPDRPQSPRALVFGDGIPIIRGLTGQSEQQARGLLGRMLSATNDDCRRVHAALSEAHDLKPAEPVAWLMAACGNRQRGRPEPKGRMAALIEQYGGE